MVRSSPKGFRCHIGLFGRRNVGKSSLLNAITRQKVSIVSEVAGTTTDPVEKPMELLPLGPVLFIDTAGIDDVGALGEMRIAQTQAVFDRTDLGVVVTDSSWGAFEEAICSALSERGVPVVAVFNKSDVARPSSETLGTLKDKGVPAVETTAISGNGVLDFRQVLLDNAPADFINNPAIVSDIVGPGELAVLVIPIDKEAPKGRLILPQVQALRDLLDAGCLAMVVKDSELPMAIDRLTAPPKLVVTDSQAFEEVSAMTPPDILMTGFSVLFARFKGDLVVQTEGTLAIEDLKPGDHILVAESCSHHPIEDDIGRVKIPRWLKNYVGGELEFTTVQGHDFPEDLSPYKLVVHCGACMWNRRAMLSRIWRCRKAGVPITNYGLAIAYSLGVLERALQPFPEALAVYKRRKQGV